MNTQALAVTGTAVIAILVVLFARLRATERRLDALTKALQDFSAEKLAEHIVASAHEAMTPGAVQVLAHTISKGVAAGLRGLMEVKKS